jgi:hypothetical protein
MVLQQITDFILLEDNILQKYGLFCNDINKEEWLVTRCDKGQLYYQLYDRIVNKCKLALYTDRATELETDFTDLVRKSVEDSDSDTFNECIQYFSRSGDYKTKLAKLTRNIYIDKIVSLTNKYSIPIDYFYVLKFGIKIVFKTQYNESELLLEYKDVLDLIRQEKKYIDTKTKYLNSCMSKYNDGDTESYLKFIRSNTRLDEKFIDKNWSNLSQEDRIDRFNGYVLYRFPSKSSDFTTRLTEFIKEKYKCKEVKYNNIKWNKKQGRLTDITNLVINLETDEFWLSCEDKKFTKQKLELDESEINEEILYYCIYKNKSIEDCIQYMQFKLNIKKMSSIDKKYITKTFAEISEIIIENPYN